MLPPQSSDHEGADQGGKYLECDEFIDVENSLLLLKHALGCVAELPGYWKWVIIAAHNALQGACVCILTETDGTGALTERAKTKLRAKLYDEDQGRRNLDNPDMPWPDPFMAPLDELLTRLPEGLKIALPDRKAERYGYEIAGDLRRLCEYRNMLVHFPASSWSLELAGLPRILGRTFSLITAIVASETGNQRNRFCETSVPSLISEIHSMIIKQT